MPRDRRSASVVLLLAVALTGLGSWFLWFEDEPQREGPAEAQGEPSTQKPGEPRLLGATGSRGETAEAPEVGPTAGPPRGGLTDPPRQAPKHRIEVVRVLDARGQPIHAAMVTIRIKTGSETKRIKATTQLDGRASLTLPAGDVVSLSVTYRGTTLLTREDEQGIDLGRIGDVQSEDLYVLRVRTVDPAGVPRPAQRVLFRPREEGKEPTGWWGATSDADGWCRLGPYALGTRIELRAGPRGLEPEGVVADPLGWTEVRVDGTDVDLVVGEVPRLRLAFPGAAPDARLWISVLDLDTGAPLFPTERHVVERGVWTAEALTGEKRLEVVILDRRRGLFARLRDVVPVGRPIDVTFERGVRISGRVILPDATRAEEGAVTVAGRGFEASTHVDARGRFTFAGLPDERFTLTARVSTDEKGGRVYLGQVERTDERDVRIPVGRAVRLFAGLVTEDVDATQFRSTQFAIEASSPDWWGTRRVLVYGGSQSQFELPAGRWRLTARSTSSEDPALRGEVDLGSLDADRKNVVIEVRDDDR